MWVWLVAVLLVVMVLSNKDTTPPSSARAPLAKAPDAFSAWLPMEPVVI